MAQQLYYRRLSMIGTGLTQVQKMLDQERAQIAEAIAHLGESERETVRDQMWNARRDELDLTKVHLSEERAGREEIVARTDVGKVILSCEDGLYAFAVESYGEQPATLCESRDRTSDIIGRIASMFTVASSINRDRQRVLDARPLVEPTDMHARRGGSSGLHGH